MVVYCVPNQKAVLFKPAAWISVRHASRSLFLLDSEQLVPMANPERTKHNEPKRQATYLAGMYAQRRFRSDCAKMRSLIRIFSGRTLITNDVELLHMIRLRRCTYQTVRFLTLRLILVRKCIYYYSGISMAGYLLTHCRLNRLSRTIYWKSPISILGTSGYDI